MTPGVIRALYRKRFGADIESGLASLQRIAGNAIVFDNAMKGADLSGLDTFGLGLSSGASTVSMNPHDFAILAFFAGVGRTYLLEAEQMVCTVEDGELVALPPKR